MRRPIRIVVPALVLPLAVLGLTACTQPTPLPIPSSASPTPTPTATPGPTVQRIAAVAQRAVGAGTVVRVDDESDGAVRDVLVVLEDGTAQEVHLSAAGRVLTGPSPATADADARSSNRALVAAASVSLAGAADRMVAAVPQGRITAIGLEEYQDRVVWRGDVTNADGVRQDVRIDAVNGSVLLNLTDGQGTSGGS